MSEAGKPESSYILALGPMVGGRGGLVLGHRMGLPSHALTLIPAPVLLIMTTSHMTWLQTPGRHPSLGQQLHGAHPRLCGRTRQNGIKDCKPVKRAGSLGF